MEYLLRYAGGWCPAYYGTEADTWFGKPGNPTTFVLKVGELVSIPLNHPDLQSLYRRHNRRPPKSGQFSLRYTDRRPLKKE